MALLKTSLLDLIELSSLLVANLLLNVGIVLQIDVDDDFIEDEEPASALGDAASQPDATNTEVRTLKQTDSLCIRPLVCDCIETVIAALE